MDFHEEITCGSCCRNAAFLFQIYSPVDHTSNDRILYFFACVNPACSKKEYFIYRAISELVSNKQAKTKSSDNLFEDDWSTSETFEEDLSEAFEESVVLNPKTEGGNECKKYAFFKSYFISVFEEPNKEFRINQRDKENFETLGKNCLDEKDGSGEGYEKQYSTAFKDDTINYHFYKRLRRCPEQIIRYDWNGQPLRSTADVDIKPDPCPHCCGSRVFELQLMPALVNILGRTKLNENEPIDIDFETILAYTCANNCSVKGGQSVHKEQLFVCKENYKVKIAQLEAK